MKQKGLAVAVAALILMAGALGLIYWQFGPKGQAGDKTITVEIVHGDGAVRNIEIRTDEAYLRGALEQEGLIAGEEGPYGIFIKTVDGETASDADRTWWCITKAGNEVTTSADLTPIADGEGYELTLSTY